jgi:thiamine kinase-like enzyme
LGRRAALHQLSVRSLTVEQAVALLQETTGAGYELVGRLSGGETGAHEVRGEAEAERMILKWETDPDSQEMRREGVRLTERLRTEAAWPVPWQRTVEAPGCLLVLQSFMPGTPIRTLTPELVDELLQLHGRRLHLGEEGAGERWAEHLIRTLVAGGRTYCLHESLRDYDARTAALVGEIETFGAGLDPDELRASDIMHGDWHLENLLARNDRLSAVVDNDFCSFGDAALDLVTLALSSTTVTCAPGLHRRLFERALGPLPPLRRRAYLGHLFIRVLDWPIRRGGQDEVEHWLDQVARCRAAGFF